MEQRVEQMVDDLPPVNIPPLTRISNAPSIIAAPNPTAKRVLKLTKQAHSRCMGNNIPGSVPPITNTAPHLHGDDPQRTPHTTVPNH
jgi:hypothetical protein